MDFQTSQRNMAFCASVTRPSDYQKSSLTESTSILYFLLESQGKSEYLDSKAQMTQLALRRQAFAEENMFCTQFESQFRSAESLHGIFTSKIKQNPPLSGSWMAREAKKWCSPRAARNTDCCARFADLRERKKGQSRDRKKSKTETHKCEGKTLSLAYVCVTLES